MGRFNDLTNNRFGRLMVLKRGDDHFKPSGKRVTMWICKCDCNDDNEISIEAYSLTSGKTTSCGCYGKEQRVKANTKHGLSNSRIKSIHNNMKSRCYNSNTPKYKNHGGRGIIICDEWLDKENGLSNFYNWAIRNGYSDDLTIDRIDNNGNYEPINCKWSTYEEQNFNRRNNREFLINGEYKSAKEWCQLMDTNINTFWQRDLKGLAGEDLIK
jgi:hypothetical protein